MNMFTHDVYLPATITKYEECEAVRGWIAKNCEKLAMLRINGSDRLRLDVVSFEDFQDAMMFQLAVGGTSK